MAIKTTKQTQQVQEPAVEEFKDETPQLDEPSLEELEQSAQTILSTFDERARFIFEEVARERSIALWMLIAGLMQRAYDNGEHTAPVLDPVWARSHPTTRPDFGKGVCDECGERFVPRWPGQKFCRTECGQVNARRSLPGARMDIRTLVGQETRMEYRSTIQHSEGVDSSGRPETS